MSGAPARKLLESIGAAVIRLQDRTDAELEAIRDVLDDLDDQMWRTAEDLAEQAEEER